MKEEKLNIEKQLEILRDKKIFKVPENYFEDFAGRLKTRMEQEMKKPVRMTWFEAYLKPALSMAAVLAILLLAVYIPVHKTLTSDRTNIAQVNQTKQVQSTNEKGDSYEALTMLPQSQFLSALEEVEDQEDLKSIDPKALEEYLADNSSYYELMTSN